MSTTLLHRWVRALVYLTIALCSGILSGQQSSLPSMSCDVDLTKIHFPKDNYKSLAAAYQIDTIQIDLVCDHALFLKLGADTSFVHEYIDLLWSRVLAIYAYDSIPLKMNNLKIWSSPDPYDHTTAARSLTSLAQSLPSPTQGHLTHLLSGSPGNKGGIAYLNGYCEPEKAFGYANITGMIDTLQSYNWDIHVVAHEIGHNLGAPHSNDCVWGPSHNQAIDGCGQTDEQCVDAPIPSQGGGIMSSCHQYPSSIMLNQGIGDEPAAIMKAFILSCSQQTGLVCNNPLPIKGKGIIAIDNITIGSGAYHQDAIHSRWYQYVALIDETIVLSSCHQGVDTRLHVYNSGCNTLNRIATSDDDCNNGNGHLYASYLEISLTAGDTILIEWDNRWSSDGFVFSILGMTSNCGNGQVDDGEVGVDCGGTCPPCLSPCSDGLQLTPLIDNTTVYISLDTLSYSGHISASANVTLGSKVLVEVQEGFEVANGGEFTIVIEDCNNTTPTLSED